MKGYSPNLNVKGRTEFSSKLHTAFIELGIKKCKDDCECEKCSEQDNKNIK